MQTSPCEGLAELMKVANLKKSEDERTEKQKLRSIRAEKVELCLKQEANQRRQREFKIATENRATEDAKNKAAAAAAVNAAKISAASIARAKEQQFKSLGGNAQKLLLTSSEKSELLQKLKKSDHNEIRYEDRDHDAAIPRRTQQQALPIKDQKQRTRLYSPIHSSGCMENLKSELRSSAPDMTDYGKQKSLSQEAHLRYSASEKPSLFHRKPTKISQSKSLSPKPSSLKRGRTNRAGNIGLKNEFIPLNKKKRDLRTLEDQQVELRQKRLIKSGKVYAKPEIRRIDRGGDRPLTKNLIPMARPLHLVESIAPPRSSFSRSSQPSEDDYTLNKRGKQIYRDDCSETNASSVISKLYNYDRNRYAAMSDSDSDMEAGFDDLHKEEIRSTRIGRIEDQKEEARLFHLKQAKLQRKKV